MQRNCSTHFHRQSDIFKILIPVVIQKCILKRKMHSAVQHVLENHISRQIIMQKQTLIVGVSNPQWSSFFFSLTPKM